MKIALQVPTAVANATFHTPWKTPSLELRPLHCANRDQEAKVLPRPTGATHKFLYSLLINRERTPFYAIPRQSRR